MNGNPYLLPLRKWEKVTEIVYFINDINVGSGLFYYGKCFFGAGNFIDLNGNLSQVRPTAEGGWKRECYQPDYTLIFRYHENEIYMYIVDINKKY